MTPELLALAASIAMPFLLMSRMTPIQLFCPACGYGAPQACTGEPCTCGRCDAAMVAC